MFTEPFRKFIVRNVRVSASISKGGKYKVFTFRSINDLDSIKYFKMLIQFFEVAIKIGFDFNRANVVATFFCPVNNS